MASEEPRNRAISAGGSARVGSGRRARLPDRPDGPGWNATCTSGISAIARSTPAVARLNSSARVLSLLVPLIAIIPQPPPPKPPPARGGAGVAYPSPPPAGGGLGGGAQTRS